MQADMTMVVMVPVAADMIMLIVLVLSDMSEVMLEPG